MRAFVIAGEPSGDALGGALLSGLRTLRPDVTFAGVGGEAMAEQGLESLFPMSDLSVMGLAEVLPRIRLLRARIAQTVAAIAATQPDLVVTIDSPDFCLRVLRAARAVRHDLPVVHYVAPSVWAWRPKRAARMAPLVDHVLALLPFEPPYMEAAGMSCDFVGHPVTTAPRASTAEIAAFRGEDSRPVILALPGSRRGEVSRLAPRFGEALAVALAGRDARIIVPAVPAQAEFVRGQVARWPIPAQVVTDPDIKRAAFGAADAALAASGTVSLELAANDVPMVIAYDLNRLSYWLVERLAQVDTVTLVNLVTQTRTIPECLGRACTPDRIADALRPVLDDPETRAQQRDAMRATMVALGAGGTPPGLRAAKSVLHFLAQRA